MNEELNKRILEAIAPNAVKTNKDANQNLSSEYSIGALEYPDGLRTKPDLQHWVAFYINVRDKAQTGNKDRKNPDANYVSKKEQERITLLDNKGSKLSQRDVETAAKVTSENSAKIVGGVTFLSSIGMGSRVVEAGTKALAAGVGARILTEYIKSQNLPDFSSGSTSRLKEVITLHVEDRPAVKYGVNYADTEMGFLTGALVEGSAAVSAKNFTGALPELQSRFIRQLLKVPVLNNIAELASRERTNAFREVLFESVDYRTFNFRYRFFPKSAEETRKIKKIIDKFKEHMHPQLSKQKLFYIYPSEFDIEYWYKDKQNPWLHKFARCALTDMAVEYGSDQFVTHEDGSPVEIGLTLTFRELEQMTSERVQDGY